MHNPLFDIPRDPDVLKLPHPQRCEASISDAELEPWKGFLGDATWKELSRRLSSEPGLTSEILAKLVDEPEHRQLGVLSEMMAHSEGSFEMGGAFSTMLFLRNRLAPQPHFRFDDSLVHMLELSDIADDVPVSMLTLPFPRFYLELGSDRSVACQVPNPTSGLHTLEGAYFEYGDSDVKGPGVFVMLTGSPLGHQDALDDATCSMFIPTSEPDRPLRDALKETRALSGALAQSAGLRPAPQEYVPYEIDGLMLLVKALLYLNLPQAKQTRRFDRTKATQDALAKKNPAKRAKALSQAQRLADVIVVQSTLAEETAVPSMASGRGVRAHWRRGHYRMQRHGVGLALQKLIFMRPMLIGADAAMAPEPAPRYEVRA